MAIERSRTETIRDFTAHAQGHQSMSMGGSWWEGLSGRGAPFLAMASCVGCGGRWEYERGRRRRARFDFGNRVS